MLYENLSISGFDILVSKMRETLADFWVIFEPDFRTKMRPPRVPPPPLPHPQFHTFLTTWQSSHHPTNNQYDFLCMTLVSDREFEITYQPATNAHNTTKEREALYDLSIYAEESSVAEKKQNLDARWRRRSYVYRCERPLCRHGLFRQVMQQWLMKQTRKNIHRFVCYRTTSIYILLLRRIQGWPK